MMNYPEFANNKEILAAAEDYKERFGGHFGGAEPGDLLMYETEDGEAAYTPPEGADAAQVLRDLQSGKPLSELWPELEDPDEGTVY